MSSTSETADASTPASPEPDALTVALTSPPFEPDALTPVPTTRALAAPEQVTLVTAAPPAADAALPRPRTRWAGIVWGLVLAAIAAAGVWLLTDPARQAVATAWMLSLTPAAAVAYAVLAVGAFALVAGIVGLARRAQRGVDRRRAASVA